MNAATVGGSFAHLRVGATDIAVAVSDIVRAIELPAAGLVRLPRRSGALEGVVDVDGGIVPVVALERWVGLGEAAASEPRIVVLRAAGSRIGIRVDALNGVRPLGATALRQACHDADAEELFQSVAPATAEHPLLCVLEVGRLMALTATWCEDAEVTLSKAQAAQCQADAPRVRYAVFKVGSEPWALPASCISVIGAAPVPEMQWKGQRVCGIGSWNGRKIPMVDLAAAGPGDGSRPLMVVVEHGPLAVGLMVSRCERMLDLAACDAVPVDGAGLPSATSQVDGLGAVSLIGVEALFAAVPEASISLTKAVSRAASKAASQTTKVPLPADGPARAAARAEPDSHYLVFEGNRAYASPAAHVLGVVALSEASSDRLARGRPVSIEWRGRELGVVCLPPLDGGEPMTDARIAVVVGREGEAGACGAIAVRSLTRWLPARAARRSSMQLHAVGEVDVIAPPPDQGGGSLVVVDLAQMAYLLG